MPRDKAWSGEYWPSNDVMLYLYRDRRVWYQTPDEQWHQIGIVSPRDLNEDGVPFDNLQEFLEEAQRFIRPPRFPPNRQQLPQRVQQFERTDAAGGERGKGGPGVSVGTKGAGRGVRIRTQGGSSGANATVPRGTPATPQNCGDLNIKAVDDNIRTGRNRIVNIPLEVERVRANESASGSSEPRPAQMQRPAPPPQQRLAPR